MFRKNKKNPRKILPAFFFSVLMVMLMASCQKTIDVSIPDMEKLFVIEGFISDSNSFSQVLLTRSMNIADSTAFTGVSGAIITISENGRLLGTLRESADAGIYLAKINGRPGNTYQLKVEVGGRTFTASSTMPEKVNLNGLFIVERKFLGKIRHIAYVRFKDPKNVKNYYRFVQRINGSKDLNIFVANDNLADGNNVIFELSVYDTDATLPAGSTVRVEMQCIEFPVYQYWYSLTQGSTEAPSSASPGNPLSNIRGGALGYFSAHTFQAASAHVPDNEDPAP